MVILSVPWGLLFGYVWNRWFYEGDTRGAGIVGSVGCVIGALLAVLFAEVYSRIHG